MPWYLRPAWLGGHLLVVAASIVMVRLGEWQWHVGGVRHGDLRNYAYALQWWAFVGFAVALWIRVMRDRGGRPAAADTSNVVRDGGEVPAVTNRSTARTTAVGTASPGYRRYVMPQSDAIAGGVTDEQARAYNDYLASLNPVEEKR